MHANAQEPGGEDDGAPAQAQPPENPQTPQAPQTSTHTELAAAGLTRPQIKVSPPAGDPLVLDKATLDFYLRAMDVLDASGVPYLVGGAYALASHAGIVRHTKDLDVFVRPADAERALAALAQRGRWRIDRVFPHWLAKAYDTSGLTGPAVGDDPPFVDVIYGSGNGLCAVDDEWFANAVEGQALGRPAKLCPAEEILWTKAFIQERERYDGADINHVILARGRSLDWARLLRRFRGHERVLLGHVMFFGYAYPSERSRVPEWVVDQLMKAVREEPAVSEKVCHGTFLSRQQYLIDLNERGYDDARLAPRGPMSGDDVDRWTDAIGKIK